MIDIKLIRENKDHVAKELSKRNIKKSRIEKIFKLDIKLRENIQALEEIKAEKNKFNKEIKKLNANKKKDKIDEMIKLAKKEDGLTQDVQNLNDSLNNLLKDIPNLPAYDVKIGKDESENEIVKKWSEPKKFDFQPKDHMELGINLGIIDTETATKVSGTRFNYLKNEAVTLQFALINFAFDTLTDKDILQKIITNNKLDIKIENKNIFQRIIPPVLVKEETLDRMSRLEPKEERYYIPSDNLYLVGSAEHSIGSMFMDQMLDENDLPIRFIGYSSSFRREAGSYGKDTQGILRVHQFDKLEMQTFTQAENSLIEQDFLVAIQEYLMQQLSIPYRIVKMCTGDMTNPDARQIDIEAWVPSQNTYRETHTSDLTTDYQARRLKTRYKDNNGLKKFVHINDATAFAIGRTLIAILENYQNKDGSVTIPKALQKYSGHLKTIETKK
ncbi:MAG: serine--tRNA ligase [bacterium]|nr:serine--tRNA ligase [bacterium]